MTIKHILMALLFALPTSLGISLISSEIIGLWSSLFIPLYFSIGYFFAEYFSSGGRKTPAPESLGKYV